MQLERVTELVSEQESFLTIQSTDLNVYTAPVKNLIYRTDLNTI